MALQKVNKACFQKAPKRYELRSGSHADAPLCPFGNHYRWIGFDTVSGKYVRLTKSVFKLLINK